MMTGNTLLVGLSCLAGILVLLGLVAILCQRLRVVSRYYPLADEEDREEGRDDA